MHWGQNTETRLEKSSLIPDNITIDQPIALSEVTLPKSDYGTLSWADDSYIPDKRVQTCEVVFKPAADVDLSYISGWDSEKKVVKGKITVVVSSIEESSEDQPSDTAADVETVTRAVKHLSRTTQLFDNKDTDIKSDVRQFQVRISRMIQKLQGRQKIRLRMRKTSRTVKQIRKKKLSRALRLLMKQNLKTTPKLLRELQPRQKNRSSGSCNGRNCRF